jgi:hypothetical protein
MRKLSFARIINFLLFLIKNLILEEYISRYDEKKNIYINFMSKHEKSIKFKIYVLYFFHAKKNEKKK